MRGAAEKEKGLHGRIESARESVLRKRVMIAKIFVWYFFFEKSFEIETACKIIFEKSLKREN